MSKFLESLVRSEAKSCAGKIQFPREDSALRAAADMMRKKPGEFFEYYKCEFGDHWHIGHRTSFDWIPASHKFQTAFLIKYECMCGTLFLTCTILSNRIMEHFPAILAAKESFVRCPKCKAMDGNEIGRKRVSLTDIPEDSTVTVEALWDSVSPTLVVGPDLIEQENQRLRSAIRNQCGDNLCWVTDPEVGKALPEAEFLESCRRYHAQIKAEKGTIPPGGMTVAQLEARIIELEDEIARMQRMIGFNNMVENLVMGPEKS